MHGIVRGFRLRKASSLRSTALPALLAAAERAHDVRNGARFGRRARGLVGWQTLQHTAYRDDGAVIVIMVPGLYAFETIVLFNRGQMLEALQASASCGFVMGALAMGLAIARFFSPR